MASNGRIIEEWCIGKDLEESGRGVIEVLSSHSPGETEENHEKPSVRIGNIPAETRTKHLPNVSLECCRYTSPLNAALSQ
jgi:hypothetical protein